MQSKLVAVLQRFEQNCMGSSHGSGVDKYDSTKLRVAKKLHVENTGETSRCVK